MTTVYNALTGKDRETKIAFLRENYSPCRLCPRQCRAEREKNEPGVCGAVKDAKIGSYNLHRGEEPPISGVRGSGTVFFSGCTLKCVFCQNFPISHLFNGNFYTIDQLADIFLNLQRRGAHNINLVTATPYLYHYAQALRLASQKGLKIPIVYNCSSYERLEVVQALSGLIDIYLPDLKYVDKEVSLRYTGVNNYFEYAYPAIEEMYRQVGRLETDEEEIALKGMILRHLILPGNIENSRKVLDKIAGSPFRDCHLSLMSQYFPAYNALQKPEINRRVTHEEYREIEEYAFDLGFSEGWFQDLDGEGGA